MQITLKQLEIVHAIVTAGSISGAKRVLQLSQPTISQQLAKIEEELGTQLVSRGRAGKLALTPAGDFWYKTAGQVLGLLDSSKKQHKSRFDSKRFVLGFGATSSFRGPFTETVAQAAMEMDQFVRVDLNWAATSCEVVEMIKSHKINCGVVSLASVESSKAIFSLEPLCHDRIVWAVPRTISESVISKVLSEGVASSDRYGALLRYVDVHAADHWRERSDGWYRTTVPFAAPQFGCTSHQDAMDIVAAGLATSLCPFSMVPNLPVSVRERVHFYDLREFSEELVFAMPKHLSSLKIFASLGSRIGALVKDSIADIAPPRDLRSVLGVAPLSVVGAA